MQRIKINFVNDKFWFNPSLITTSKRLWAPRPYKNLKKLLVVEKLWDKDLVIDLNGDADHKILRQLLQYKDNPFKIKKEDFLQITKVGFVDIKLNKSKIYLRFDKKGFNLLKKGILPFYQYYYLRSLRPKNTPNSELTYLIWRKDGFSEISKKLKEKLEKNLKE